MDVVIPAIEKIREDLALIEERVVTGYTLADAIREGSAYTDHATGKFISIDSASACALSAAWVAAKARGFIPE